MSLRVENVKIISSYQMRSKPYGKIESRKSHAFLYRIKGWSEYVRDGSLFRVNAGELLFIPKGARYEYRTNEQGENLYTSINFEADVENAEMRVYSLKDFQGASHLLQGFSKSWQFGTAADRYKCLSIVYDILSFVAGLDHRDVAEKGNYRRLHPALLYLREHIYKAEFKVSRLHRLCGISDAYFRRIFKSVFSVTPQEYVLRQRLTQARFLIESGEYDAIRTVAEAVGYSDPLYFSKAFKKHYGFSPSAVVE